MSWCTNFLWSRCPSLPINITPSLTPHHPSYGYFLGNSEISLSAARWERSLLNPSRQYLINTSGIERVPVWSAGRGWGQRGGGDKKRKKQTGRTLYLAVELSPSVSLSWIIIVWQRVSCRAEVAGMHCSPPPHPSPHSPPPPASPTDKVANYCAAGWRDTKSAHYSADTLSARQIVEGRSENVGEGFFGPKWIQKAVRRGCFTGNVSPCELCWWQNRPDEASILPGDKITHSRCTSSLTNLGLKEAAQTIEAAHRNVSKWCVMTFLCV